MLHYFHLNAKVSNLVPIDLHSSRFVRYTHPLSMVRTFLEQLSYLFNKNH